MFAHLNDPPSAPTAVRKDLPEGIDQVVSRAMAKSPEERYASAGAMARATHEALRPSLAGDGRTIKAPAPVPGAAPPSRPRRALIGGGVVAALVAITVVVALVGGDGGGAPARSPSQVGQSGSASPSTSSSEFLTDFQGVVRLDPRTGDRLRAEEQPFTPQSRGPVGVSTQTRTMIAAEGALWVDGDVPPSIFKLDPAIGRLDAEIELPILASTGLGAHQIFAAGESSIWVLEAAGGVGDTVLLRIQPATNDIIARIPIGLGGNGLAFGREGLWVLRAAGRLSEIDIQGRRIGRTIEIGAQAGGLAIGAGFLWVTSNITGTLYRVDPASEAVQAIDLAGGADAIAADDDGVWVLDRTSGTVVRVDPESGDVGDPVRVGEGASSIAVGASAVWVPDLAEGNVYRIDAESLERTVIPLARAPGPTWVAVGEGGVWVSVG